MIDFHKIWGLLHSWVTGGLSRVFRSEGLKSESSVTSPILTANADLT
jgi:hypothetical protein